MTSLQNYTLTAAIQGGGDASLHRGLRDADRLPVTVKLTASDYPTLGEIAQIRYELSILKGLDLPGVVKALELEKHGNGLALVMEELAGEPLSAILARGRLDLKTCLRIAEALAETVAAVHQHQIIHKNLKPQNVFVELDGDGGVDARRLPRIKLLDFGIAARLTHEHQRAKSPASLEGTLAYMSPEQTGRMNRVLDHRTDLYSFGVLLYEMLTGALPFPTTDPMELVHSHIARKPKPPRTVSPEVPEVVSDLVMKLLSKAAEDRYHGAHGLQADLEACLRQLDATGKIAPFPLAAHDVIAELRMPQKLYGRDPEIAVLTGAWTRAGRGGAELFLVSGYAGVGKSALVNEIYAPIVRRGAHFITGKFDQLGRNVPYAPLMHAFRELIEQVGAERESTRAVWKRKLLTALGSSAQVILDVIPEVEQLIGPQPAVPALGPTGSQNRFNLVFQSFLRVFTTAESPLVLFLDDLQWADLPSLKLLRTILTAPNSGYLLVIGAYRDNEVTASHPLSLVLSELRKAGVPVNGITLKPLDLPVVRRIMAAALSCDEARAAELSELVFERTQGNPFFMSQLLIALHKEELFTSAGPGAWTWELDRIRAAMTTDDVVAFMADKIQRLSPGAQRILKLGACIGHEFDLRTSAIISEQSVAATSADLWEALRAGLIEALDSDYRYAGAETEAAAGGDADAAPPPDLNVSYRFLHDRVQQAAYSLIEQGQAWEVHLQIGQLMRARHDDADLFAVVSQVNMGAALVRDPHDRLELARLNLAAGEKAKAATAYDAAAVYFAVGRSLLDDASWAEEHALSFALCAEQAECEYMRGDFERAEDLFEILLSHAETNLERAHIHNLRVVLHITLGQIEEAVSIGLAALALLRMPLPAGEAEREAEVVAEHAQLAAELAGVRLDDLLDARDNVDPEKVAALKILANLTTPSWVVSPNLFALVAIHQVKISFHHGHTSVSAIGYMAYGWFLAAMAGSYEEAYRLGRFALELNERARNVDFRCKLNVIFAGHISFYRKHLRSSLDYLRRAYDAGLESGDLIYLSYRCTHTLIFRIGLGDDLVDVLEDAERCLALMARTKVASATAIQTVARQMVASLMGRTQHRRTLSDDTFNEAWFLEERQSSGFNTFTCFYYVVKLQLAFLYEDYPAALSMSQQAERRAAGSVGHFMTTELAFYTALTLAALYPGAAPEAQNRHWDALVGHHDTMVRWADGSPDTFRHKTLLLQAEIARISGDDGAAMDRYEQAIEAARACGDVRIEALGLELGARYHQAKGRPRIARVYLTDAYYVYLRWGAIAKAEDLAERYPERIIAFGGGGAASSDTATTSIRPSGLARKVPTTHLDSAAAVRAAQAISSEVILENVLDRLLRIVIESAGAQKAVLLLLQRDDQLTVEASLRVDPDEVRIGPSIRAESSLEIPISAVHHVLRTGEPLVLGNATFDARFAGDPYIVEQQTQSVLCMTMAYRGRITGVLYLENSIVHDVFTLDRVVLCSLLSSQAAIAIENALLYRDVQKVTAELKRSNEMLEEQVEKRTAELHAAMGELREANARLRDEFSDRGRADAERAALQEEVIRAQMARLAELSTPIIPISDRIVVMPLIGTMDADRAEQVLASALAGAGSYRAAWLIIDITGVKTVDSDACGTLLRTAGALRMLGTRVVLTGIRPEVAQTLVGLGIDFSGVVTCATLRSGVEHATRAGPRGSR